MTKGSSVRKIGIFGHVGTQNMGDEIIIAAVIQNIRSRYPDAEICAFTFNPEDTQSRHGIPAFPIRRVKAPSPQPHVVTPADTTASLASARTNASGGLKAGLKKIPFLFAFLKAIQNGLGAIRVSLAELAFIARSRRNLKGTDLLMIAGSGQLTDQSGGPWAYPYTFFKWSMIARAGGAKLAFVSIGTGWIESSLSKFFLKSALGSADYRSFREESSAKQVAELGLASGNAVVPDLAYSLEMPAARSVSEIPGSRKVVGINPIPFFHETLWHKANKPVYDKYVESHADFALWLMNRGYAVLFFPTQLRADPSVIADIIHAMERRRPGISSQIIPAPAIRTGEDLVAVMARMDIVVAARFHGVLVSHLLHKPVLAVSYHQKTADLMSRMGQQECTLDIDDCSVDALAARFIFLESRQASIREELARRVPACRVALDSQYEQVFGLMKQNSLPAETLSKSVVQAKEPSNARINYGS